MSTSVVDHVHEDEHHHDSSSTMTFGFWIYILSDLVLFSTLFANFIVFASAYGGGKSGKEFIDLTFVGVETALLLVSSLTYGLAMIQMYKGNLGGLKAWIGVTFLLGLCFIGMELYEFHHLLGEVYYFEPSAYLGVDVETGIKTYGKLTLSAYWSAFFILVGTHGIHVTVGLIWMGFMFVHLSRRGLDADNKTRFACLSIFWHFLDIVWVGVFTTVYLMGAL